MGHLWVSALGEETLYEVDLPRCCQRSASSARSTDSFDDSFECPTCGAFWQAPLQGAFAAEPEECAFTERASDGERKGAA